ncbi:hypothetical protein BDA96_10G044200 [Sorghum bicolor]|uniref:Morc S5 domain-containing protein n=2 Tax=Sorghum bicolor TaxID=4558 RepID=A0A921TYK3_SORBI|nr:protein MICRORCHIDIA 6 [Sorghum bicolor]EER87847.2 hypothetical protein SORBI_3010G038000 [Sorghum bicolor]KAG0512787.1 hypothetical protein BDA96_10G044200 [Sorghum bicolor]|eukprot:XP_021304952.1 protein MICRORCHIDIA 6 [Sorghum bicolor]
MDAQRDTKPSVSPIITATGAIQRSLHGRSASQPAPALPSEHGGGARVLAGGLRPQAQPQPHQAACVLNRAASELSSGGVGGRASGADEALEEGTSASRRPCVAPRLSRKFWSAGDYDAAATGSVPQPPSVQNRMCIHPEFLHSNATSHKWPFGAVAELLDNAVDEIEKGRATTILLDKIIDKRNGSPALLVQDDGGGMDPNSMRRCMSFGFSEKQSGSSIGQYGNGFKTSTMRLGADAIVFSRCIKSSEPTQSIGLLSYTFLVETGQTDVVVPVVDYKCNLMKGQTQRLERHGSEQFSSNLSVLLKWSPFATEEELMQNFCDIGPHGTKIIVFNLWSNEDGKLELDFDTDPADIMISGAPNPEEISNSVKRTNENHLANRLRYSLRVYASVLYLQLPDYFRIILRGQEVKRHSIIADLMYPECITYKPQGCGIKEAGVLTTIGFLNGSPTISVHGFNIYHRNRLILPFHRVLSSASSKGRGVSGVLEAGFIKPTHDKQDFEKSQLFQRLINRLKDMTNEYWDIHSHKIGYVKTPRRSAAPTPPAPPVMLQIANGAAEEPSETPPLRSHGNYVNAVPIAFAPPGFNLTPVKTEPVVAPGEPMRCSPSPPNMQTVRVMNHTSSPSMARGTGSAETRKRRNDDSALAVAVKRQAMQDLAGSSSSTNQVCQYMGERELREFSFLKMENQMLHEECSHFEAAEKELLLKEQNLRLEIEKAQEEYKSLLNEHVSVSTVLALR